MCAYIALTCTAGAHFVANIYTLVSGEVYPGTLSRTAFMQLVKLGTGGQQKALAGLDNISQRFGNENFDDLRELVRRICDVSPHQTTSRREQLLSMIDDFQAFLKREFIKHLKPTSTCGAHCLTRLLGGLSVNEAKSCPDCAKAVEKAAKDAEKAAKAAEKAAKAAEKAAKAAEKASNAAGINMPGSQAAGAAEEAVGATASTQPGSHRATASTNSAPGTTTKCKACIERLTYSSDCPASCGDHSEHCQQCNQLHVIFAEIHFLIEQISGTPAVDITIPVDNAGQFELFSCSKIPTEGSAQPQPNSDEGSVQPQPPTGQASVQPQTHDDQGSGQTQHAAFMELLDDFRILAKRYMARTEKYIAHLVRAYVEQVFPKSFYYTY